MVHFPKFDPQNNVVLEWRLLFSNLQKIAKIELFPILFNQPNRWGQLKTAVTFLNKCCTNYCSGGHILDSSFLAVFRILVLTKPVSGLVSEVFHNFCIKVCLHILLFSHKMDTHLKFLANLRPIIMAKHQFKTEDCGQRLVDSQWASKAAGWDGVGTRGYLL